MIKKELLTKKFSDLFDYGVKIRGKEYYEQGNIKKIIKVKNQPVYKAIVEGTEDYEIRIEVIKNKEEPDYLDYDCSCPYESACKHVYACLLAIDNKEYEVVNLKPEITPNLLTLSELISLIPAEELKQKIIENYNLTMINHDRFFKEFDKYVPKQSYEYYYNNLYNKTLLDTDIYYEKEIYIENIKIKINNNDFNQSFLILKSIIEVSNELNINISDDYPLLASFYRICYRKGDKELKKEVINYKNELIKKSYYNNVYLEDLIESVNYEK